MISKIRKISLKNKVHMDDGNREEELPLNLAEIVPSDKDNGGLFNDNHERNKAVIDAHIRDQDSDNDSNDNEQEHVPLKDEQTLKRASTFVRFSTSMQNFFANMRKQQESEESTDEATAEEAEPIVPVNPMQHLLGAVSNNAYVSWTHVSKVIKALEVVHENFDMNASDMNKAMLQQCITLLKDSPYVLKSKKDDSLAHKSAKFYKKSEIDENGNMIVNKPSNTVSKSRRASLTALSQLRKVVEFNTMPYGKASNDVSQFVSNMVQLHLDPAFDIFSEEDGQTVTYNNPTNSESSQNTANTENEAKTEVYDISGNGSASATAETENSRDQSTSRKLRRHSRGSRKMAKSYVIDVSVSNEISDKISQCLDKLNSWNDFNVFELFEHAGHMSLPILATYIFKEYNLVDKLGFNESKLLNYFQCIQQVYNADVPYHNAQHGADVLVTAYQIVKSRKKAIFENIKLQNHEMFSLFLAATVHDTGHKGKNNDWHIRTQSDLALLYNDISVLENYHVAAAWKVLTLKENDFFNSENKEDKNKIRKLVTDIVLHTDMSRHGTVIQSLGNIVDSHGIITDENGDIVCSQPEFTDSERKTLLQGIVHTADISNPAKKFDYMFEWTNRICTEFWKQGDEERERGLDVSPLCDRENPAVEKNAIGFAKFVVLPLLQKMQPLFGVMDEAISESNKNLDYWGRQLDALNKVTEN